MLIFLFSKDDAHTIFRDAATLNMTEAGHVWIATEQALNANNTPDGVLGLQLVYANSEKEHIRVSLNILKTDLEIEGESEKTRLVLRHCRSIVPNHKKTGFIKIISPPRVLLLGPPSE